MSGLNLGNRHRREVKLHLISLERAVDDLKSGKIDVLVTAPIDKQNIQSE
ncbi:MAG: 4-hydroxythreonine-4-phosphate dehydrogenase PdxA [Marinilabiliales bacterium]|nr:4-hydroxythreonine-4-phosphate dehydrogenase PdxA [Marinilabiliales bacterium]